MGNRSQGDDDDDDAEKNGHMKKKRRIRRAEMERVRRRVEEEEEEEEKPCSSSSLDKFPERTSLNRVLDFNITADGFLAAVQPPPPVFSFLPSTHFDLLLLYPFFLFLRFDSLDLCFLSFYPCFAIFCFSIFAEEEMRN